MLSIKNRLAFIMLGVIAAFVVLELTARILEPNINLPSACFKPDNTLNHVHVPGKTCEFKTAFWDITYKINSHGLRDNEYAIEKPPNTFRILALGDSFTEGWGVEAENSFPERLENLLNTGSTVQNFEVINSGVTGYSPVIEYLYFKQNGLLFEPDLVILTFDMTDFADEKAYFNYTLFSENQIPYAVTPNISEHSENYLNFLRKNPHQLEQIENSSNDIGERLQKIMVNKSALGRRLLLTNSSIVSAGKVSSLNRDQQSWNLVKDNILLINQLALENQIEFLLIIFPHKEQLESNELFQPLLSLDEFANGQNFSVLNLIKDFQNFNNYKELYFRNDPHFSNRGHELVAKKIFEYLKKQMIVNYN